MAGFSNHRIRPYNVVSYERLSSAEIGLDEQNQQNYENLLDEINRIWLAQATPRQANTNHSRGACLRVRRFRGLRDMVDIRALTAEYNKGKGFFFFFTGQLSLFSMKKSPPLPILADWQQGSNQLVIL